MTGKFTVARNYLILPAKCFFRALAQRYRNLPNPPARIFAAEARLFLTLISFTSYRP